MRWRFDFSRFHQFIPENYKLGAWPISVLDHALATADQGLLVFPLRPLAKIPTTKGWKEQATTDPNAITQWFNERQNLNYGIRTGSINNLHVVDLDGPEAQRWWKSTGFHNGAIVDTPSGPERTHHYFRIDGEMELPNTKKKLHPFVDTRGEGGLVPGPGSMLSTGTYKGDIRNIPMIPEGLLAILPEKQVYSTEEFVGEQVEAASDSERRQIASAIEALEDLPRAWVEGAGWRSEMYRVACWLNRMANSPAYAMTREAALSIIVEHTPTDSEWGLPQIMEQWESAIHSTVGQFASPPVDTFPPLIDFMEACNALPALSSRGEPMLSTEGLVFGSAGDKPGADWKRRRIILTECFRFGLSAQQAATIAWGCKAGESLQYDQHGERALWEEVEKARATVAAESGADAIAPADDERPALSQEAAERVLLLSDEERALVATQEWFGTRYVTWAETRVSMMNAPYHRMNLWTILSLVFSDCGFIPKKKGPMYLNLFQMVLGKTTTGKTEALEIMRSVIHACFAPGDSPDIGGDATPSSLVKRLIERDGKVSWFNADEAHGLFAEMEGTKWRAGLREKWTYLYEGRVPIILRNGDKDISGIDASTFFIMYLMGTKDGMTKALDAEQWESGFLARYLFAIGEELEPTPESFIEDQVEGDVAASYTAMPKQWAVEFSAAKANLKNHGTLPLPMKMTQEALDRHTKFKVAISRMFNGHRQADLIKPTIIRFANSIRKCATLVAMSEGSPTVNLRHELIALEAAEEWLTNIVTMVNQTTATGWTRAVDDVERFVASQKDGTVNLERVYGHFPIPTYKTDEYITQLVKLGRVAKLPREGDNVYTIKIKEQTGAMAA